MRGSGVILLNSRNTRRGPRVALVPSVPGTCRPASLANQEHTLWQRTSTRAIPCIVCRRSARCGRSTSTACRRATSACPAGENIQAWLAEAQAGRYREAWEIIVRDNPMPAVHGRVCYHPCEDACNRKDVDEAVSIHAVERFLGDMALDGRVDRPARRSRLRASACSSSAPDRAACRQPGTWLAAATRSSSTRRDRWPAA